MNDAGLRTPAVATPIPRGRGPGRRRRVRRRGPRGGVTSSAVGPTCGSPGPSSYEADLARLVRDGLSELGLSSSVGQGQIRPAQAEPGRAVAGGPARQHPSRPWSAPWPRCSGLGVPARSSWPRGRGTAGTRNSSSSNPASARCSTEERPGVRRPEPRRRPDRREPLRRDEAWRRLHLPASLSRADLIVSLPKMKTHHWAGVTLAMKNLFGVMPGVAYGWPKNVLHHAGIAGSILDINAAVKPPPGHRRRHRRHGGGRADHGLGRELRRAGLRREPARRGRDGEPG